MSRQEEIHFYINKIKNPIPLPNKKFIKLSDLKLTCIHVQRSSKKIVAFIVSCGFTDTEPLSLDADHCLSLHYHMWGSSMGSFIVYTYSTVRGLKREYRINGDQGNQWNNLELDLKLDNSTWVRVTRTLFAKLYLCVY